MSFINNDMPVPYFITNKEWYYYDDKEEIFKLTDKATEKAKESYIEYYNENDTDL
jgi:ubiquitin C-terminal hydrolase